MRGDHRQRGRASDAKQAAHDGALALPLPVLGQHDRAAATAAAPAPRGSRIARWRAATLIAVHLVIIAHIVHWQFADRTLGSFQFSEAMATLEGGPINPGFLLFGLALLITALCGRVFCGWACHMGGLQDLCLWLMRKGGLRPAPFRTRLLPYLPLAIGGYMFIWPTAKRIMLVPLLEAWWPGGLRWIGTAPAAPRLGVDLATENLWQSLPGPWLAMPFLLVCGVATVYFLGSRGFCRYACPYGGLFKPIERLAPGRIVVDADRCDECGRCTAACSSNVRVLDELREHGAVVSAHCVRSLDCVSVCPQNALAYSFQAPAVRHARAGSGSGLAMMTRRGDPTISGEFALLGVFTLVFFVTRGLYGAVPLLFAAGIGICAMPIAWKLWRLMRDRDVRLHRFQLRRCGTITPAGRWFILLNVAAAALLVHSAAVRAHGWYAGVLDHRVAVRREVVFGNPALVPESMREDAAGALRHYQRASSWRTGGIGLARTPLHDVRAAWLHLVRGELEAAETCLRRAIDREKPVDHLCAELGRIVIWRGESARAEAELAATLASHPAFAESLELLVRLMLERGEVDAAQERCRAHLDRWPDHATIRALLGRILLRAGDAPAAADHLTRAMRGLPHDPMLPHDLAIALFERGDFAAAMSTLEQAGARHPPHREAYRDLADALRREHARRRDASSISTPAPARD